MVTGGKANVRLGSEPNAFGVAAIGLFPGDGAPLPAPYLDLAEPRVVAARLGTFLAPVFLLPPGSDLASNFPG